MSLATIPCVIMSSSRVYCTHYYVFINVRKCAYFTKNPNPEKYAHFLSASYFAKKCAYFNMHIFLRHFLAKKMCIFCWIWLFFCQMCIFSKKNVHILKKNKMCILKYAHFLVIFCEKKCAYFNMHIFFLLKKCAYFQKYAHFFAFLYQNQMCILKYAHFHISFLNY